VNDKLRLFKLNKLKKQIDFLRSEFDESYYIFELAMKQFNTDFHDTLKNSKKESVKSEEVIVSKSEVRECNILFKKIARVTHPDKLITNNKLTESEKTKLEKLYKDANKASKKGDYDILIKVANDLGFDEVINDEKYLEKTIAKLSDKIKHLKTSYAWVWYHETNSGKLKNLKQHIERTYS